MRVSCELFEIKYPINVAQLHISFENDRLFCASKPVLVFTLENTCVNLKIFQVKYILKTSSKCFWPNASHTSNVFVLLPDNYNLKFIFPHN